MGYYSTFDFSEYDGKHFDEFSDEVIQFLNDNKDKDDDWEYLLYASEESCKFYHADDVLKKLSVQFPDKIFHMSREGEESGGMEQCWYKNGKMKSYRPEIIWPDYKEEDLK